MISPDDLKQVQAELSEEELTGVAGGGAAATLGWIFANVLIAVVPVVNDAATGGYITKATMQQ